MIEGRVFDIQRFCVHDGPGIRTTVFLAGCPLRCAWCHNPEGFSGAGGRAMTAEAVMSEVLEDRDYYAISGGGVTLSGGEPLQQPRFARELLAIAKREGLHTCVQTAGAVPASAFLEVIDLVDLFFYDLKHMDPVRHRELTGAGNERILENAALLASRGATVDFRVPVIPGVNDDAAHLECVTAFLGTLGVGSLHLVPYQRTYLAKYQQLGLEARFAGVAPPSPEHVEGLVRQLGERGVAVCVDA